MRIRWPKSSDFGPKSDDWTHRIIKSKNGIGLSSSKILTEQSRPGTAAVRDTHKSTSSDRCLGLRIRPRCENAVAAPLRSQTTAIIAAGQRGLGLGEQEEQHTQRVVRGYHTRVHTERQLIVLGSDARLKKMPREAPRRVSSRSD